MKQIVPASAQSDSATAPDHVFNDAMEEALPPRAPFNVLHFIIAILLVGSVFSLGVWSVSHAPQPPLTGPYDTAKLPKATQSKIIVHVAGAVRKPGVYTLPMDARLQDALQKAGGTLPNGDANQLNLAAWAEDGSRIEVPFKSKTAAPQTINSAPLITIAKPPAEIVSDTPEPTKLPSKTAAPRETKQQAKPTPSRKINLNKATLEELTALPGVGPATAEKIIEQRKTSGAFSSVDDLDEIKGIGEKKLEKIRPYATVR